MLTKLPACGVMKGSDIKNRVDSLIDSEILYAGIKELPQIDGVTLNVKGFYVGSDVGGGQFYYDPLRSKADHNGGTVIAPEAIAAWDGTSGDIATLLDWSGAGAGCFARLEIATIHIEFFGGSESVNDNSLQLLKMWELRNTRKKLCAYADSYSYSQKVTLSASQNETGIKLEHLGNMVFNSQDGIELSRIFGSSITIGNICYLQEAENASVASGVGMVIRSCWSTDFDVTATRNFITGSKLIGGGVATSGNGMAFCNVYVRNTNAPSSIGGIAMLVTTEPFSTTPGYFNENHIKAGFIRGEKGIVFVKGNLQTDPFNGNKLLEPQIENAALTGIELDFCSSNVIHHPRFEGGSEPSGYWIDEKSNCSRNDYYITGSVGFSKIRLLGILQNYIGRLNSDSGGALANQMFGGDNGSANTNDHDLYLSIKKTSDTPQNTVCFGGISGQTRFEKYTGVVVDGVGIESKFGWLNPYGSIDISSDTQIPRGISNIRAQSASNSVVITMNKDREENGYFCLLEVTFYTNDISIAKSTGAVTVPTGKIASEGLYILAYRGDTWKVSRVGDKF